MPPTYSTQAIILSRTDWREYDSRLLAYSPYGKLDLIVRGSKKPNSKLAAHIEPFNLVDLMVVRGRQFDYLGGVAAQNAFAQIKSDLNKLYLAGRASRFFRTLVSGQQKDQGLFALLYNFLFRLNSQARQPAKKRLLFDLFIFKFLAQLGYGPQLQECVFCHRPLAPGQIWFDAQAGGLVCPACRPSAMAVPISTNGVKLLRLASKLKLNDFSRIYPSACLAEFSQVVDLWLKYYS